MGLLRAWYEKNSEESSTGNGLTEVQTQQHILGSSLASCSFPRLVANTTCKLKGHAVATETMKKRTSCHSAVQQHDKQVRILTGSTNAEEARQAAFSDKYVVLFAGSCPPSTALCKVRILVTSGQMHSIELC
jgi:hypothetical protein